MTNGRRDYQKEDKWDKSHKKRTKDRAARNAARAKVAKMEGKKPTAIVGDIGHSRARSKGGSNSLANLFVQNSSQNRSFSRTAKGAMKSELSLREKKQGKTIGSQKKRK